MYSALWVSQAVGVTLTNCSLLVASAWGIFYYREVRGWRRVLGWAVAAVATLAGMSMLAAAGGG